MNEINTLTIKTLRQIQQSLDLFNTERYPEEHFLIRYIASLVIQIQIKNQQKPINNHFIPQITFAYNNLQQIIAAKEAKDYNFIYSELTQIALALENILNQELSQKEINEIKRKLLNQIESIESFIKEHEIQRNTISEQLSNILKKNKILDGIINKQTFEEQNNLLSKNFKRKATRLQIERIAYIVLGIPIIVWLGITYLSYSSPTSSEEILTYTETVPSFTNHILLVIKCTPFIFFAIWLFCQAGRVTHLAELYSFKATLGATIKATIDYTLQIEGDDHKKELTLQTLHELLTKLYQPPLSNKRNNQSLKENLSEITDLLKETKGIIESIKPTSKKTNDE